ncbi:DUF4838 domain-containing protein [Planobacterium oryzisoli]|uniref:DUF4838 domain-containing protein n=1 Tax=Planobacterium oryzisoli TaxID=2771435 RepID=A0A931E764_9FLAO|nr:DUF4838 domain-containing protein [Planobacterium oryzisoli]MBF5028010.1 DUF4838 domain-containing protein [Planobacterium oryzisoli]
MNQEVRNYILPFCLVLLTMLVSPSLAAQNTKISEPGKALFYLSVDTLEESDLPHPAFILQDYLLQVTGNEFPIVQETAPRAQSIRLELNPKPHEMYRLSVGPEKILLQAASLKTLNKAVYHFIEESLGCRKWAPGEKAQCPTTPELYIKNRPDTSFSPSFAYRDVYSLGYKDPEYLQWHGLHTLDEQWGLWGHSYNKLVSPKLFATHPQWFGLYRGKRLPNQLCLTHPGVFQHAVKSLGRIIADNPQARYFSIGANDDLGHCECAGCSAINKREGSVSGTLVDFTNRLARHFPKTTFSILAYQATKFAPRHTALEKNVVVFLSTIDIYRSRAVPTERSAALLRSLLLDWKSKASQIFVWDYYTQFTNYLVPFPDDAHIGENLAYYQSQGATGIFAQMAGDTYNDSAELKSYVLAKTLWDASLKTQDVRREFIEGYYREAAPYIMEYHQLLHSFAQKSGARLDIYGSPVSHFGDYLHPTNLTQLHALVSKAQEATSDPVVRARLERLALSLDYTKLQHARIYGFDAHGLFVKDRSGHYQIDPQWKPLVEGFVSKAQKYSVKEISEGGDSPAGYKAKWDYIFSRGVPQNLAHGASVHFSAPWVEDYPAKRQRTLTDGMYGFSNFSYNWLLFSQHVTMTLDLGERRHVKTIETSFLENQRRFIFLPEKILLEVSSNGKNFVPMEGVDGFEARQNASVATYLQRFEIHSKIRYIRLTAHPLSTLPKFSQPSQRKPLIATDEIWVQ